MAAKSDQSQSITDNTSEQQSDNDRIVAFHTRVEGFLEKHTEIYDKLVHDFDEKEYERRILADNADKPPLEIITDKYCVLNPPLETYMEVDSAKRKERFFTGDLIKATVTFNSASRGLIVRVMSFSEETLRLRDIADLKIRGVVKLANITIKEEDRYKVTNDLYTDDMIRAVVVEVDKTMEVLGLSLRSDHLAKDTPSTVSLGYIDTSSSSTSSTSNSSSSRNVRRDYLTTLTNSAGFNNPTCVKHLKAMLGISAGIRNTFVENVLMMRIADVEYFDGLKYMQKRNWAMRLIKSGIKYFKRNRYDLAKAYFDFALNIDGYNMEGLVARGALNANRGDFEKGIKDLQFAVDFSGSHKNARTYLVRTYIAYGEKLEAEKNYTDAIKSYKKALKTQSSSQRAKNKIASLSALLEPEAAEKIEEERKKSEETLRLKKLRKIVKKERRKTLEADMHGPKEKPSKSEKKKKRKSKRRRGRSSTSGSSHRTKKRKRQYTSSDEYDTTSSSDESSSVSPEIKKRKSKRRKV